MKKINLLTIRIDGGTQARVQLNQDVVKEYAEKMRDGEVFPPVTVFHDGAEYWLADGFHRYFGTKANGITSIEADVKTGTLDDAILFAFSANGRRGLSMSAEDNRKIIMAMLKHAEWSKWALTEIAKHVGVSKMTVSRVKASMETPEGESTVKKYKYKDEVREMDTAKVKPRAPTTKPDVTTANPTAELNDRRGELTDTINSLAEENTLLRDKIAIGQWDASEIEKIDAEQTIKHLRDQIRMYELDNKALRESRDMYQNRNAELTKTIKSLTNKLKKLESVV
jgi:uncharacterized protein (DUF2164 family)